MRLLLLFPVLLAAACATMPPSPAASSSDAAAPQVRPPAARGDGAVESRDSRLRAAPSQPPSIASPVTVPLDAASLAKLPRESIVATAHEKTLACDGIALAALLRAAGAMPAEPLRGAQLARYVQVDARDGYRVVYALAELDPTLGNHAVYLTDRCDGKPLAGDDGPLRLVAPGDARPARWVRQVKSITVIVAP